EQVLLLRYKELVDQPLPTLDRVCRFLRVSSAPINEVPQDNSRRFVQRGPRTKALSTVIRTGAAVGQFSPPEVWRKVSKPLVDQLQRGGDPSRPRLTPEQRDSPLEAQLREIY